MKNEEIHTKVVETQTDVKWIRVCLEKITANCEAHQNRLSKLESGAAEERGKNTFIAAGVSVLASIIFGILGIFGRSK